MDGVAALSLLGVVARSLRNLVSMAQMCDQSAIGNQSSTDGPCSGYVLFGRIRVLELFGQVQVQHNSRGYRVRQVQVQLHSHCLPVQDVRIQANSPIWQVPDREIVN